MNRVTIVALAGICVFGGAKQADAQFAVSPVIVQMPASSEVTDALISIDNEGDAPMQFRVYVMDFDQSVNGDHAFAEPRTIPQSCAGRLNVAPGALMVGPGERGLIQVRLQPAPSGRTCWSMVFIETPSTSETGVRINQRIGVKLYGLSGNAEPDGALTYAEASDAGDTVNVSFLFSNPGDWPVRPEGSVEIRDVNGLTVAAIQVPSFSVLPNRERRIQVAVPAGDLSSGRYLAVPILDFGAEFLAGAQVDFRLSD